MFFPAADTIAFAEGGAEVMRIDSAGNVGIGTSSPNSGLQLKLTNGGGDVAARIQNNSTTAGSTATLYFTTTVTDTFNSAFVGSDRNNALILGANAAERARITSDGDLLVGKTSSNSSSVGFEIQPSGVFASTREANVSAILGRNTDDGQIVQFRQAGTTEGTISVSGTTVSYNGGHLSRWAQFPDNSRPELLKGTVMSNLDQMSVWGNEENEQLNCVQVSTVEGDANVAGVFVAWDSEDDGYNDILLAMTGDMVIRIAAGTTVQRGDLLMSAGDGTAKPQGDDIVRSKTIAKVTSTHVSHTYADGSYAVPCVLMAC
jgi:hypothetical protein